MIVVKAGGRALTENMEKIVTSIAEASKNHRIILVHGGGELVTEYSKRLGIEPRFVTSPQGVRSRYTTREELEVFVMALGGLLNKKLAVMLARHGAKPIGLTGIDGFALLAKRRKRIVIVDEKTRRRRVIPGGYTGKVVGVNNQLLRDLLDDGYTPVIAPIAYDPEEATLLNVDGDQAAARIAASLRANALIILTDVDGLIVDGKLVNKLTLSQAIRLVEEGKIGPGMNRKIIEVARAVEEGVEYAVITNASHNNPVAEGLKGRGTVLTMG
ncbi:MAG: acetylaminoadipate kinase [Hyperthermus sp.]|nr:MAG: acetylaminoadipate kinase [Hyperthermus sp.]